MLPRAASASEDASCPRGVAPTSSYIASCCSRSASSSTALTLVRKSSAAAPATSGGGDFSARRKVRKGMTVISRHAPTRRSISATSAPMVLAPRSCPRTERCDAERLGDLVDFLHHRGAERNAVLLPLDPPRQASLAGHANFVEAREPMGGGEVADVAVDFRLEQIGRDEARDVERDHELPDIELAA